MEKGDRKRKPLSDITNTYNLFPTPPPRTTAAVASTNSTSHSIIKSSSVSSNQKLCSESSNRSDASIGGAWSSRSVQFRTPPPAVSSIASPGDTRSKDTRYKRKPETEEITKERSVAVVVASPAFVEKSKNIGRTNDVPFSSSPPDTTKDNQNEILDPSSLLEREKQKGSACRNLFNGLVEMTEESNKSTLKSYSRNYGKTKRWKGIADSSSFSLEKTIGGEKSGSSSDENEGILKQSGPTIVKIKEIENQYIDPLNSLVEITKEKEKPLSPVGSSIERTREKGKAIMQLPEVVEVMKSKGSSTAAKVNTRPPRRKSVKRKIDTGVSSCPPCGEFMLILVRIDLDEPGGLKFPKSWTDAHPKSKKKLSSINDTAEFTLEFVEQQKAEIDAVKLLEEEISEEELDQATVVSRSLVQSLSEALKGKVG